MGIGIWLRVDPKSYEPSRFIDTDNMIHASWIMMITGFIIILIGFVGLIGVITENSCLLATVYSFSITVKPLYNEHVAAAKTQFSL
jgi:hypothetical protein